MCPVFRVPEFFHFLVNRLQGSLFGDFPFFLPIDVLFRMILYPDCLAGAGEFIGCSIHVMDRERGRYGPEWKI